MKKILFILLASLFLLGACGSNSSTKSNSVDENKPQFTNDTLVLDQAVLKIKDTFLIKNNETGKKEIVFKYEVKNKTDDEAITPGNVWSAGVEVKQDENNTVTNLDTGMTIANGGKYKEWTDHNEDTIKKGKTVKGLSSYQLKNNNDVILNFTKGIGGKKLGSKKIDISQLKTVDYSTDEDVANQTSTSENNGFQDYVNKSNINNSNTKSSNDNKIENGNNNGIKNNDVVKSNQTQVNSNQQQYNQKDVAEQSDGMTQADIDEWNKTKPTTHDDSQMESVSQTHSGGHPSIFGTEKPLEENNK